jgi:membrane-associated phospholipid phosphatase
LLFGVYLSNLGKFYSTIWFLVIVVLNGIVPYFSLLLFTKKGYIFDDTLDKKDVHKQRMGIYLLILITQLMELLVLALTNQSQPLLAILTTSVVIAAASLMIIYFWKISLHSTIITFVVGLVVIKFGLAFLPLAILILLMMWSRVVLKRHTLAQVIAGSVLTILALIITFNFYGLIRTNIN